MVLAVTEMVLALAEMVLALTEMIIPLTEMELGVLKHKASLSEELLLIEPEKSFYPLILTLIGIVMVTYRTYI